MTQRIRILHVEDDPLDAELMMAALQEQGIVGDVVRVDGGHGLREALERGRWDIILSDFTMPTADGASLLSLAHRLRPETPFIFVSGTIGEERAVNALREGATDYILKDRLSRMGPAITRALRESQLVAERTRAVDELRGMHVQLQRLLAASPAVIYSARVSGESGITFVSENVRLRFGYEPRELVSNPRFRPDTIHPEDRERVLSSITGADGGGYGYDVYRLRHKDGGWRWVEDYRSLIRDSSGKPLELVGSWLDVTQRKGAEDERATLEARIEQAQRLESIGSLAKMLERLIGEHNRIELDLDPASGHICCDTSQFDQILVNLIVNARDAMPTGGLISVGVHPFRVEAGSAGASSNAPPGNYVRITVSDTGVGIPQELLNRIFDPFFTTKPIGKGTGLGLSLVYGAVSQNKGSIEVESELGAGATFRVVFRRYESYGCGEPAVEKSAESASGGETILLVEDDTSVRRVAGIMLREAGYQVIEAGSGQEALDRFDESGDSIDMMVTDLIMPGMGGRALAVRILKKRPDMKVMFCTGYDDELSNVIADANNGRQMINKPFSRGELLGRIRSFLDA